MTDNVMTARLVAGALVTGTATFWVLGWVITGGGAEAIGGDLDLPVNAIRGGWAVLALGGFAVALVLRNKALESLADGDSSELPPQLVIAWAMLEGPALFSGVFLLLMADVVILWAGALVFFAGMAITFPRAEWFASAA